MNWRQKTLGLILPLFLLAPGPALAASSSLSSRTFLFAREFVDESSHVTLYEYLDLGFNELALEGLSFQFGGWGRVDLADETYGESTEGEFQYGYLGYRHPGSSTVVRLGRLYVNDGVAAFESLDGLSLSGNVAGPVTLAVYGGVPVVADEEERDEDLLYGGRIGVESPGRYGIGLSYLKEENEGLDSREEVGVDFLLRPLDPVTVTGYSSYSEIDSEWMEHDYRVALGPWQGWTLSGEASWYDYDAYFQPSAFSAFASPLLGTGEQLLTLGGELGWEFAPGFSAAALYRNYDYETAEQADAYGARFSWNGGGSGAGITYHRVDGSVDELRYSEYRGFVTKDLGRFDVSFDALDVVYDEEINDVDYAYALAFALGYDAGENLRFSCDAEYSSNPLFKEEVTGMAKLFWRFSSAPKGGDVQ